MSFLLNLLILLVVIRNNCVFGFANEESSELQDYQDEDNTRFPTLKGNVESRRNFLNPVSNRNFDEREYALLKRKKPGKSGTGKAGNPGKGKKRRVNTKTLLEDAKLLLASLRQKIYSTEKKIQKLYSKYWQTRERSQITTQADELMFYDEMEENEMETKPLVEEDAKNEKL